MKRKEIRFAIGKSDDQASPIWRLWSRKNDVYLTARTFGGFVKISMHAPNDQHPTDAWIVARTTESGAALKDRRMKKWDRPPETIKGWTWGPRIAIPVIMVHDFKIDEKVTKHVDWIPVPPVGMKVTIGLGFAGPQISPKDVEKICGKDRYSDDFLELDNLEKVFVAISYDPLTKSDRSYIAQIEAQAKQITDANKSDVKGFIVHLAQSLEVPFACSIKFGTSRDGPW